jgi:hypothetical protein
VAPQDDKGCVRGVSDFKAPTIGLEHGGQTYSRKVRPPGPPRDLSLSPKSLFMISSMRSDPYRAKRMLHTRHHRMLHPRLSLDYFHMRSGGEAERILPQVR